MARRRRKRKKDAVRIKTKKDAVRIKTEETAVGTKTEIEEIEIVKIGAKTNPGAKNNVKGAVIGIGSVRSIARIGDPRPNDNRLIFLKNDISITEGGYINEN